LTDISIRNSDNVLTGEEIINMISPAIALPTKERAVDGYSLGDADLDGKSLIIGSWGYDLVVRLKDTRPLLTEEIFFWANLLSRVEVPRVDVITAPPANGKVPAHEHLASILGSMVAWHKGICFRQLLWSPVMRKTKGNMQSKLDERANSPFFYYGPGTGAKILVVDDAMFTRGTVRRCRQAIRDRGDEPLFLVLYRG